MKTIALKKEDYNLALDFHICSVVFMKKDRSYRRLICTRASALIPKDQKTMLKEFLDNKPIKVYDLNIVTAFDLTIGEWRSFDIRNVMSFRKLK